jgi:8-oxo-dGTP pyrophosphatase MutT (NUDIX family)/phosphohistidine phosphatase SixA
MPQTDVLAAGAVVFRPGKDVLLIHRPRYDDWSFPKGKLDPGEHVAAAAVREVAEETGLRVRLGPPLAEQQYTLENGNRKVVSYWVGRVVGDDDVSGYAPNNEVDAVEWVAYDKALDRLTHDHDRDTLREAGEVRRRTHPVVILRHSQARSRKAWRKNDRLRPLLRAGQRQAAKLVPVLAAYDATRIVSSSSTRCVETVAPYVDATGRKPELVDGLSEQDATRKSVAGVVEDLVAGDEGAVLCTHRPVLPKVFEALGVKDPGLDLGEMLVVHVRKGEVVATERHLVR